LGGDIGFTDAKARYPMDSSTGRAIKDEEPLRKFRLFIFMLISENKAGLKQSLGRKD